MQARSKSDCYVTYIGCRNEEKGKERDSTDDSLYFYFLRKEMQYTYKPIGRAEYMHYTGFYDQDKNVEYVSWHWPAWQQASCELL